MINRDGLPRTRTLAPPANRADKPEFLNLVAHVGHKVQVATYGSPNQTVNVAVECIECFEVITDVDRYGND